MSSENSYIDQFKIFIECFVQVCIRGQRSYFIIINNQFKSVYDAPFFNFNRALLKFYVFDRMV